MLYYLTLNGNTFLFSRREANKENLFIVFPGCKRDRYKLKWIHNTRGNPNNVSWTNKQWMYVCLYVWIHVQFNIILIPAFIHEVATSENNESKKYSWVKDDIWFHLCIIYSVMSSSLSIILAGRSSSSSSRAVCLCVLWIQSLSYILQQVGWETLRARKKEDSSFLFSQGTSTCLAVSFCTYGTTSLRTSLVKLSDNIPLYLYLIQFVYFISLNNEMECRWTFRQMDFYLVVTTAKQRGKESLPVVL